MVNTRERLVGGYLIPSRPFPVLQCQVYGCCNERKIVHEGKASNSFTKFLTGGSADFGSWKTYVAGSNPARNIENYLCFFVRPMEG